MTKELVKPDYFLDIDDDMLNFLEVNGEKSMEEIYQSNSVNKENAHKLLNIMIVGIGAAFLVLTKMSAVSYLSIGLLFFLVGWSCCAIYIVLFVLRIVKRNIIHRPPSYEYTSFYKKLSEKDYYEFKRNGYKGSNNPLSVLRRDRLSVLSNAAMALLESNGKIGKYLSRVTITAVCIPAIACLLSTAYFILFK